ncbi:hypothetical protein [Pedobacter sp. MW01-1-1]|uniref:hypothetical protein n=1 Tax=Pedobacter sp. MW01-1-1 TaxID=3383027 RepID=UPI003FEFC0FB
MQAFLKKHFFLSFFFCSFFLLINSQDSYGQRHSKPDSARVGDVKDFFKSIFNKNKTVDSATLNKKYLWSFLPAPGYTANNGFTISVGAALSFLSKPGDSLSKISNITTNVTYTSFGQTLLPFQANVWSKDEKFNYIVDWKYMNYPSDIWGPSTSVYADTGLAINFSSVKLHQTLMYSVFKHVYFGAGYYFDKFWNISPKEYLAPVPSQDFADFFGHNLQASGPALRVIYDTRLNQINPKQGTYLSATFRNSAKFLGSAENWNALTLDMRHYTNFPRGSKNTLAFWALGWYSTPNNTPYFLMPSVGWDDNQNTGRGTAQGRYRGWKMNYFESEYRFQILKSGFLGGAVFVNAQTYPEDRFYKLNTFYWGGGVGLRIKLNKFSGTNVCIDFGIGQKNGIATNIGEVF